MSAIVEQGSITELVVESDGDLLALAAAVATHPELWADRVVHDPEERTYTRLHSDGEVEVWVLGWCPGQATGLHDHDGAAGAVSVVEGSLVEELICADRAGRLKLVSFERRSGTSFAFDGGRIHDVRHSGLRPSTSIHVYSPPISRMGSFEVTSDGLLTRRPVDHTEGA